MGRRIADVSPPVKPPGPDPQVVSSNPGVCQLSPSWHVVLYFHILVSPKMLNSCADAGARLKNNPMSNRSKVRANRKNPSFARRGAVPLDLDALDLLEGECSVFIM